jgi:SAM-dependent methyltransferase
VAPPDAEPRSFESIYAEAGTDFGAIPWADLAPNPTLTRWLQQAPPGAGARGLIVGCGLGDDAEELARRGVATTGFDVSATAIARCHERFPDSPVAYVVADVFALPTEWQGRFDIVIEIRTLQSLPPGTREDAARSIAATLGPYGKLLVSCFARGDGEPVGTRPWPVSLAELRAFEYAGLEQIRFEETPHGDHGRTFTITYLRPPGP